MGLMAVLGSDGDDKQIQVDMLCVSDSVVIHVRYSEWLFRGTQVKFDIICKWVKSCLFSLRGGLYTIVLTTCQ